MKLVKEETDKFTEKVIVGDEIRVGGLLARVDSVETNSHDECVYHCTIIGAQHKKRSTLMLIIPKQLPIETLK